MVRFTHVLCAVDLNEASERVLAYAARFAERAGARLTALHVVPSFEPMEVRAGALFDPVRIVQPPPREAVLDAIGRSAEAAGIPAGGVSPAAEAGEAADTIVGQAVALGADLLVMGTHGRRGVDRLILGSVTEEVLRRAPCPVLTVPPHAPPAPSAGSGFERIVCPVDFSPASKQAAGFALDLAARSRGSVTFVHVLEWPIDDPGGHGHFDITAYREHMKREARQAVQDLIAEADAAAAGVEPVIAAGRPYREILRIASDQNADLIIMGAQGRGGAALVLFGSTTQQVLRAARCPVLTVRGVPGP